MSRVSPGLIAGALLAVAYPGAAYAQNAALENAEVRPGLTISVTPYLYLPVVDTTVRTPTRGGGTETTTMSVGPDGYIPKMNLGAMGAAEVRYDRFSVLTDVMYLDVSTEAARINSIDFGGAIPPIGAVGAETSTRLHNTVWTLAGGYTVAQGGWGNADALAGFRLLSISQKTNFILGAALAAPNGTLIFGQTGGVKASGEIWNGIAGVRGRLNLGNAGLPVPGKFFIPYYFDIGGGDSDLTWQLFTGVGYQMNTLSASLGYRHLEFHQGGSSPIRDMTLRGPMLTTTVTF